METSRIQILLGLAAAMAILPYSASAQNPRSMVGKPAPKLEVSNWLNTGGKPLSLDKLRGKVVVLDFWAYW